MTPPTFAPNGAATWYAGGIDMMASAVPKMAYTLLCVGSSVSVSLTVVMPSIPLVEMIRVVGPGIGVSVGGGGGGGGGIGVGSGVGIGEGGAGDHNLDNAHV